MLNPFSIPRTKEEVLVHIAQNVALTYGFHTAATWIINSHLKIHYQDIGVKPGNPFYRLESYRVPSSAERFGRSLGMMTLNPATPVVAAGATALLVSAAVSGAYEIKVNQPIRKGTSGTFFGPYASGFGSVV